MLVVWREMRFALGGGVALAEQLDEHLARVVFHRQRRVVVAERQRGAVVAGPRHRRRPRLDGGLGRPAPATAARFPGPASRRSPGRAWWPCARRAGCCPAARADSQVAGFSVCTEPALAMFSRLAMEVSWLLVLLQRLHDLVQLEVRARAAGRPGIDFLAVRRVVHDRAVREVEEPDARSSGTAAVCGQRGGRRNHRVEQRQAQRRRPGP